MKYINEFGAVSTEGPICPYCEAQFTADEKYYYDEYYYTEDECQECKNKFNVFVFHETRWKTTKVEK